MTKILWILMLSMPAFAQWEEGTTLPGTGKWADGDRANIYNLDAEELAERIDRGKQYAITYPVDQTAILFPYKLFFDVFDGKVQTPLKKFLYKAIKTGAGYKSSKQFFESVGMPDYPKNAEENYSDITTFPKEYHLGLPMGVKVMERFGVKGITFGCAGCHTSELFGRKVVGLTNRFPEGTDLFAMLAGPARLTPTPLVNLTLGLSGGEAKMIKQLFKNIKWVRAKKAVHKSLDSSFSQVGMTLHYREKDGHATKKRNFRLRKHPLEKVPADSKPMVWWNVKYKNRWLADGSVVSGNPVFTNFLWNEIGRGIDLPKFEKWLDNNKEIVKDMTAAIFATKPPYYGDFFSIKDLDIDKAKRGEKLYVQNCQKCHGQYIKNWSLEKEMPDYELFQTMKVRYHRKTPVYNVGTSDYRLKAMPTFKDDLNRLVVSKKHGTVIKKSKGYVPPPLVGIWARWPYFHNNSIPSLCALLTPASKRPKTFWTGKPVDPQSDFDQECNGYPLADKVPAHWKKDKAYFFDTRRPGMSNQGHDKKILLKADGSEKFTKNQKLDLIEFLKTL